MKKAEATTGVRLRQLDLFNEIQAAAATGPVCKHPQKAIHRAMLIDTCMQCGMVRAVKPDPMVGRIEGPWAAPVDKRLGPDDLSEDQREVFDQIVGWVESRVIDGERLLTIGGLAGSGKSTLIGVLAAQFPKLLVAYATYTGRASSVLQRKLRAAGVHTTNHQARPEDYRGRDPHRLFLESWEKELPFVGTLHKLLYRPVINDKEEVTGWTKRKTLDRKYDLLVIDECFHYAQSVLTEDGWVAIGKIVNTKRKCRVWAYNRETGTLELKPIIRWLRHRAPKRLLRIDVGRTSSMRSARILRCTPEHKILTPEGYDRAGDLKVGDDLVVRGRHLTPTQFSMLVGSMLGDGSMDRHPSRNSPQPKFTQGEDQLEWLKFKHSVYGDLAGKITRGTSGYTNKDVWKFTITVTDQARRIAEQMPHRGFHPGGRRRWSPTDTFLGWVDELALAVWFLDDGSLHDDKYATLHSEGFDQETHERFVRVLWERFGLDAVIQQAGDYLRLRFNKDDTEKFFELIRPFVPACMAWKVPGSKDYAPDPSPAGEITVAPITKISTISAARSPWVYDLEVRDHHNYVAGNVVVSNCSMVGDDMLLDLQHHRVPILAVGDHGQLPPVMASGELMRKPALKLLKIHRQARDNPIILFSRHARKTGLLDPDFEDGEHIVFESKRNVDSVLTDAYRKVESNLDVALLCWTNRNRIRLNIAARKALKFKGSPSRGEVLICLKNMRDANADIYNGMRGVVEHDTFFTDGSWTFDCDVGFPEEGILPRHLQLCAPQFFRERVFESVDEMQDRGMDVETMLAGGALFDFGYAMTVHKSQGSQAKHVVFYVEDAARSDEKLWRKLAYTAITRASEKLTVLL